MKNLLGKLILIPLFVLILSLMTVTNASAATYNLFGKITKASGGNVSGATIDVLQANTTTVVQSASSNSVGNYTLNVEEGTYNIRVTPPSGQGLGISITEDFQISENSSLNFTLVPPPVTVQGTITDYLGNPLENSNISFQYQPTGTNYGQQTDSNGHYFLQVPTGTFNILIDGTTDNTTSVNIPENWQVGTPDYEITGSATINYSVQVKKIDIHVEDPSHNGVENANIKVNGLSVNDRTLGGGTTLESILEFRVVCA